MSDKQNTTQEVDTSVLIDGSAYNIYLKTKEKLYGAIYHHCTLSGKHYFSIGESVYPAEDVLSHTISSVSKRNIDFDELKVTEEEGDVVDIYLCPNRTPVAYERKRRELINCGMTEREAENCLLRPIPVEIFYSLDQGLFAVESECLSSCEIYNPYTGKEIPNDNLH